MELVNYPKQGKIRCYDIVPAKAMGMRTIWIRQGFGALWNITKKEEEPDCSVSSLMELKGHLVPRDKEQGK